MSRENTFEDIVAFFVREEIPLIPCHGIKDGICTCRKKEKCHSPGKHPLYKDWKLIASCKPEVILGWLNNKRGINLAVATGRKNSAGKYLVVVDGDLQDHPFLQRLKGTNTLSQKTGGGGDHVFFWSDFPVKNSQSLLEQKVDVRGSGGILVIAPSSHKSGNKYKFTSYLPETKIQEVPEYLAKLLRINKASQQKPKEHHVISQKTTQITTEGYASVAELKQSIASGNLIPEGVRNSSMHRLLSSERAKGATKFELYDKGKQYLQYFTKPDEVEDELSGIVASVMRYPCYNNSFDKVNAFYFSWLKKNGHDPKITLEELERYDREFFDSLNPIKMDEPGISLAEIASARAGFMGSKGLTRFSTYKSQLLAKKLESLGIKRKRTSKGNLWQVSLGDLAKLGTKSQAIVGENNMSEEEKKVKKEPATGDIVVLNGEKHVILVEEKEIPVREHSREHLYQGRRGYDYNKAFRSFMGLIDSDEKMEQFDAGTLVLDREETLKTLASFVPGQIIGVVDKTYKVAGLPDGDGTLPVIRVAHQFGGSLPYIGQFKEIDEQITLSLSQIDFARTMGLLDILWFNDKPVGEAAVKKTKIIFYTPYVEEENKETPEVTDDK